MFKTDYQTYLKNQITRAESKWARKDGYEQLFKVRLKESWNRVKDQIGEVDTMICMGCRSGTEVFEFKEYYPDAEVWGVDITENINKIRTHLDVKIVIQDFNRLPEEWTDNFDLVFSNSLDHAFNVQDTLREWLRVAKPGGHLFLELSATPANRIEHELRLGDLEPLRGKAIDVWENASHTGMIGLFKV